MSLCHFDHFPYSCDDGVLHQMHHHHHHQPHHNWCNAWFHSSCLTGQVSITKENGFQLQIDVHHFKYDELTVKTMGDWIIVEGKQSNDKDLPVCITKHFSRKYKLPRYYDSNLISSSLSSDGILIVKVPPPEKEPDNEEKIIEIEKSESFSKKDTKTNDDNKNDKNDNKKSATNNKESKKNVEEGKKSGKKDKNLNMPNADTTATSIPPNENPGPSSAVNSDIKTEEVNENDNKITTENDDKI